MTENPGASTDESDFSLWAEVLLAGCLAIIVFDALVVSREWLSDPLVSWGQLQVGVSVVLLVWQSRKAATAIREIRARGAK